MKATPQVNLFFISKDLGLLLCSTLLCGFPGKTQAADGAWSSSAANPGLWSTTSNWNLTTVANGADSTATFGRSTAAAQTIRLDSARTIGNISITNGNANPGSWLLDNNGDAANILTLDVTSGSPTLTVGANYTKSSTNAVTISAVIAGNDGLTKAGNGRLILSRNNTYSGTTTVSAGQLVLAHSNALGSSSTVNVGTTDTAELALQGGITISSAHTINLNPAATTPNTQSNLINLSGNNTVNSAINISTANGNVRIESVAGTMTLAGDLARSGTSSIVFQGDGDIRIEGDIIATSAAIYRGQSGSGTLYMVGAKSFTSLFGANNTVSIDTIANGGVASSLGASSNAAANLVIGGNNGNAGRLIYTGGTASSDRNFSIGDFTASSATWEISNANTTLTLTGGANTGSNTAGNFGKDGAGRLIMSGLNRYTGRTTVTAGTLQFATLASLYNSAASSWIAANLRVASGATLAFNVGGTGEFTTGNVTTLVTNLAASTSATNGMNAGSFLGFDTTNASGGTFTISNVIANTTGAAGGSRGLVKLGTGILVLSNTNTYTGGTIVNGGTLNVTGSLADTGAVTVNSGTYTVGANDTVGAVTLENGTINGGSTLTGSSYAVRNGTVSASLAGSGALTKNTGDTVTLSGTNSYTGSTLATGGTLVISGTGSIAPSTTTVSSGATLEVNGLAGTVAVNANGTLTGIGTLGVTTIAGHHSPGNSPGVQNFGSNLSYTNGSSVTWELIDNTEAGRGINFDGIDVVGELTITGTSTINLVFNLGTSDVLWADSFWDTDQSWLFYEVGGSVSGAFALGSISVDSLGNSLGANRGMFSIGYSDAGVSILYTAIPEPSTTLLLMVGLMATLLLRRRSRDRCHFC